MTTSETTKSFSSNPYKNYNFTECQSEVSLQSSGNVQIFATQDRDLSKRRVQERKQLLHKNSYYNDRILRTLLRSNSKSKPGQAYASQDNTLSVNNFSNFGQSKSSNAHLLSQYKTPKERFEKPYITHHNMPIQSKINKGVGTKLQSEASPRSVFGSEF